MRAFLGVNVNIVKSVFICAWVSFMKSPIRVSWYFEPSQPQRITPGLTELVSSESITAKFVLVSSESITAKLKMLYASQY